MSPSPGTRGDQAPPVEVGTVARQPPPSGESPGTPRACARDPGRRDRHLGQWLFVVALCTYALLCNGYIQSNDVLHTLSAAESLVLRGDFAVDTAVIPGGGSALGVDGRPYAPHGIGMTLLFVPFVILSRFLGLEVALVAAFLNPLLGAVAVWAFFAVLRAIDVRPQAALGASWLFAFASIHAVYSTISFDVVPAAAMSLIGLLGLARWYARGRRSALALSGAAFAVAILVRLDAVLVVAAVGLVLAVAALRRNGLPQAASDVMVWSAPLAMGVAVTGWYNVVRFGAPFDDGHGPDPQVKLDTPLLTGLLGQLASPGKSVFLYTPLLVAGLLGLRALHRRSPLLARAVVLSAVSSVLFHAKLVNWPGDVAWGPRFLVPLTGPLLLGLGPLLEGWRSWSLWRRGALVILATVSGLVQWLGIASNVDTVMFANPAYARSPHDHFMAGTSPLRYHGDALSRAVRGDGDYLTGPATGPEDDRDRPARLDGWWLVRPDVENRRATAAALGFVVVVGTGVVLRQVSSRRART